MTMSTADLPPKTQSCIEGDAFDLICCFYDGVDDIVHEVARQIAEVEGSFAPEEPGVVLITREHVEKAGCQIVETLRPLLANGRLPHSEKLNQILDMTECFDQKRQ
jgi:hypothetical protein